MKHNVIGAIKKINYLTSEIDSLYHQSSVKLGISDSVSIILYSVWDEGESCLLSDIYKKSGISKQDFINQTIVRLQEAEANAFATWTEEEINTYIQLMEKYADCFRSQIEKL